ncbi:MAG: hypothetical protein DMF53_19795 [Acidobacteria bacterium]|nr:MAG: hypothetical protein DMF53_19795 [Acidobacteriota bacterium]
MKDRKASISKARSYAEMGEYWDTHDASKAWDQGEPVEFEIDIKSGLRRPQSQPHRGVRK